MKKLRIYIALLGLSILFILSSCTKKKSCSELTDDYSDALTVFITNPTQQTCENYIDALRDYIDGCSNLTPAERAALEDDLDNSDCNQY